MQVVVAVIMKTVTSTHMFLYMALVNIFLEDIVIHWKKTSVLSNIYDKITCSNSAYLYGGV